MEKVKLKLKSKSVRQVIVKGDYIVMSRSLHERIASLIVFLPNTSSPARTNLGRHSRRESSNKRVTVILRSDWSNQSSLRNTSQKEVDMWGINNPTKVSHKQV